MALLNGVTLVAIAIWIFVEAYQRFSDPPEVLGGWMLAVAAIGLVSTWPRRGSSGAASRRT